MSNRKKHKKVSNHSDCDNIITKKPYISNFSKYIDEIEEKRRKDIKLIIDERDGERLREYFVTNNTIKIEKI